MNDETDPLPTPPGGLSVPSKKEYLQGSIQAGKSAGECGEARHAGLLIINADDWGSEPGTTRMILDCVLRGAVSSVSAMVFMEDSERAAAVARERGIEAGLHLNFTSAFSVPQCPMRLREHQQKLAQYLLRSRLAQVMFHPALTRSFEYLVAAQLDEFRRLYGSEPELLDGHRHMHLCANVLLQDLLPHGTLVRRNFSFQRGEKGIANRLYRRFVDGMLLRRHRLVDFFFSLVPLESPGRLHRIFALARQFAVEVMAHPANPKEYRFLEGGEIFRHVEGLEMAPRSVVLRRDQKRKVDEA
ncbi:MAG TPA: ChbG/HpnK family deacetylase [Candidatus Acidoferrum sp.]|nr:ChbG/HpnK family deacetylase [Candidatus Acidoferrum sp.]